LVSGIEIRFVREGEGEAILWVSRHPPLKSQIRFLEKKFGNPRIIQLSGRIPNAEYVAETAQNFNAKVIIPVLPLSFIARLVELSKKYGFEVWWAEMEQIGILSYQPVAGKDYNPETDAWIKGYENTYKIMRFKKFHRIKRVVMEMEEVE